MALTSLTSSIDTRTLLERCMGNSGLVAKLMNAFANTLPIEQCALQAAIEHNDLIAVARISHKLKGTAWNMCANSLAEIANLVEQAARAGQIDKVADRWIEISLQIENILDSISTQDSIRS